MVSTGARLISRGITPAKPEVGTFARTTRQRAAAAVGRRNRGYETPTDITRS
jgi:hypothetical protein